MNYKKFKNYSLWLSQISSVISLVTIVFIQSKFIFQSGSFAGGLLFASMVFALLALIFGIVSLPRWQGFVSLIIFGYVAYCILFTRLYGIA